VATTVTGWTDNGVDYSSLIAPFFGTASIPPHGQISVFLILSSSDNGPWVFSGQDSSGAMWSQQFMVTVNAPLQQANLVLSTVPSTVLLSTVPGTAPGCPWPTLLTLQETSGYGVELAAFQDTATGLSPDPQQIWGTFHIAGFGTLQALVCPTGITPPMQATYAVGGTDRMRLWFEHARGRAPRPLGPLPSGATD